MSSCNLSQHAAEISSLFTKLSCLARWGEQSEAGIKKAWEHTHHYLEPKAGMTDLDSVTTSTFSKGSAAENSQCDDIIDPSMHVIARHYSSDSVCRLYTAWKTELFLCLHHNNIYHRNLFLS